MNMAKERFIRSGAFAMSTKTIAEANLYDDELFLFSCYGNTAMTELILGIILGQPVKVRSFTPQKTLTNAKLSDKSVRFDVELADRTMCDIEVQNTLDAGFRQRTRYNAASLDTHMLRKGQHYTELRRSIVVVITPSDPFHKGLPVYHVSRTVQETGKEYGDGSEIVYLNGQRDGDDAVGDLAHDLRCTRPEEMRYDVLREAVKPYKDLGGGQIEDGTGDLYRTRDRTGENGRHRRRKDRNAAEDWRGEAAACRAHERQRGDAEDRPVRERSRIASLTRS